MEYDEIRITTRREIAICTDAIKRLENIVGSMEIKHGRSSEAFRRALAGGELAVDPELQHWHDCCLALDRWQARLAEHRQIMRL